MHRLGFLLHLEQPEGLIPDARTLPLHKFKGTITLLVSSPGGGSHMAAVDDKVKQIVVEQLGVEESEVTPKASFVDDLGADSLDQVELVMAFEEAFDVERSEERRVGKECSARRWRHVWRKE